MSIFLCKTIGIIGAGDLGSQVVAALYDKCHKKIIASRTSEKGLIDLKTKYPEIITTTDNTYVAENSDVIIIGVKPKKVEEVCKEIKDYTKDKLVISIAAVTKLSELTTYLSNPNVVRVMTGLFVEEELAFYTLGPNCIQGHRDMVKYIFGDECKEYTEPVLLTRMFAACELGLMAKDSFEKTKFFVDRGISEQDAREMMGNMHIALGKALKKMPANVIYDSVGGQDSFTQILGNELEKAGVYESWNSIMKNKYDIYK